MLYFYSSKEVILFLSLNKGFFKLIFCKLKPMAYIWQSENTYKVYDFQ